MYNYDYNYSFMMRFIYGVLFFLLVSLFIYILIILINRVLNAKAFRIKKEELDEINYYENVQVYMDALFGEGTHQRTRRVSSQLVANFESYKQFDYLIKYFNLIINDETISLLNNLKRCTNKLIYEANNCKNNRARKFMLEEMPYLEMQYISPQGASKLSYKLVLTPNKINEIIENVDNIYKKEKTSGYQRVKLTKQIRESILARDNWTCQRCGNSVYNEPNLLLEVDHIIPISKGGKTEPNNLQTLCWRCNRSKSDNIDLSQFTIKDED